ncbi:site-specific recombinase [Pseudaquabacterium terrae]|uniref:site-specific recombinase n=1 Tax=Pseudaquabacterium terrae TaxID=2732868 RepID=UPI001C2769F0|nr:site-specific recombinase [Aquabacterium terrae]
MAWDLTALLNAADPKAARPERHTWLVRLVEWLRHGEAERGPDETPRPVLRLKHLLNVLERHDEPRQRIVALLGRFWRETDLAALFADFGFTARRDVWGEIGERLRLRFLPATPDTDDPGVLFALLFTDDGDAAWLRAIDETTLRRLAALFAVARADGQATHGSASTNGNGADWRAPLLQGMTWLVSAIHAAGLAPQLRRRMSPGLLADRPFEQLVRAGEAVADALSGGDDAAMRRHVTFLRALLERCHRAAASVTAHLEEFGVSVHIVFELEQLDARIRRLEALLGVLLSDVPQRELQQLLAELVALSRERFSLRALLARQYSLLARKVAERHAETGEHYITRTRAEYRAMLAKASGGGGVIALTVFLKFGLLALGLAPFWNGFAAGLNYALCFIAIHLLHWTVATKQPAMTAPAMAEKLANVTDEAAVEDFVDEVAHLVRSQIAGIVGNLAMVIPVVLALQWLAWWVFGRPLVGDADAVHVLHSLPIVGPTLLYAAFTGILLFGSSFIAGWVENWFVYHRLDSALAHHPAIVARLGASRASRWAHWWRHNISGLAANASLGLLLGLVPTLFAFIGLPIDVRHVTLSTGQLAAAASTLGWATLQMPVFWSCVASLPLIGVLNLGVSFWLALRVALRSRGITLSDQRRLYAAIRRRVRERPRSFLLPD